jgi:hypothetical protein
VLCIGNVAQFPLTRQAAVSSGCIEVVQHAFHNSSAGSKILDHYCMWALRMLVQEPGAALRITSMDMGKLAAQCASQDEHALAFCAIYVPWAVEQSLSDASAMQVLCTSMVPSLVAPHLVRLLPRSAAAVALLCEKGDEVSRAPLSSVLCAVSVYCERERNSSYCCD